MLKSITIHDLGKKFRTEWIFRNVGLTLEQGDALAVYGNNGSGKSTFLQIVSGFLMPSEGTVTLFNESGPVTEQLYYQNISLAAPYLDMPEELTLLEHISFYSNHKTIINDLSPQQIISKAELTGNEDKLIRNFSSGMKMRLKVVLALISDTGLVLLDEPLSNLDEQGYDWYEGLIDEFKNKRIFVVCSNNVRVETKFCNKEFKITDHKP